MRRVLAVTLCVTAQPQGLPALFTPPRHERVGFDFVTDKNKQVTYDRCKHAELLVPALGFDWRCLILSSGNVLTNIIKPCVRPFHEWTKLAFRRA